MQKSSIYIDFLCGVMVSVIGQSPGGCLDEPETSFLQNCYHTTAYGFHFSGNPSIIKHYEALM
jgi:hypothetical protein